jgi:hypothetical protein
MSDERRAMSDELKRRAVSNELNAALPEARSPKPEAQRIK